MSNRYSACVAACDIDLDSTKYKGSLIFGLCIVISLVQKVKNVFNYNHLLSGGILIEPDKGLCLGA